MTNTYDTSAFPLGSKDPRVLYNNASNLDDAVNAFVASWIDRFGRPRKTYYGMEVDFANMLASFGYEPTHLIYTDGQPLQVSRPTQLIDRDGSIYRVKMPATFPVSLTGSWASDAVKLVDVGDQSLRIELAADSGYELVGGVLSFDEQLIPAPVAGSSLTRGVVHAMYRSGAEVGAIRMGGSDLTPLNDELAFWSGLPSQNAWGDPANIGFCSASFNRNGASYAAYSTTFGHDCVAYGTAGIAFGAGSCVGNPSVRGTPEEAFTGYCSIAGGKNVFVPGQKAAAFGEGHTINTRAGMGFGYSISSQPSVLNDAPVGTFGMGQYVALLGQAFGLGSYISAADTMVVGSGITPGSVLTGQPGELSLGANSTLPAIRIKGPGTVGAPSRIGLNNNRDLNHSVDIDIPPNGTVGITVDGVGAGTVSLMGLKADGSELHIADIVWYSGSTSSATGGLSIRMLGRSSNAFVIDGDGSIMMPELKTSANISGSPAGTVYKDMATSTLKIL